MGTRSPITPWIPVLAWMFVIFGLGSASFEHEQTSRFIGPLLRWLFPDHSPGTLADLHDAIRKLAHVVEYAVQGLLVARALAHSAPAASWRRLALPTLALVAAVAALDENRQSGLEQRTGSARDVLLDLFGGALGFGLAPWIVHRPAAEERADE